MIEREVVCVAVIAVKDELRCYVSNGRPIPAISCQHLWSQTVITCQTLQVPALPRYLIIDTSMLVVLDNNLIVKLALGTTSLHGASSTVTGM